MIIEQNDLLDIKYALEFTCEHSAGNTTNHKAILEQIKIFEANNPHYTGYYALIKGKREGETKHEADREQERTWEFLKTHDL